MSDDGYEFDGLPLGGIRPGTTVLVAGPTHGGARELGIRMLAGSANEGTIVITTNQSASRLADDCQRVGVEVSSDRTAIIDCVSGEDSSVPARIVTVSSPGDLTGIGMRFSDVYMDFKRSGVKRVRTGIFSISTLLSFSNLQTVSRFVHTLAGRIDSVDGLGVLLIDPANHDERTVSTLSQFCGGRIDVRDTEHGPEFRTGGLSGNSRKWTAFDTL